ncbi:MAG: hypothetical protein GY953_29605, partial [bacterium]|nr:hypothetical protein [bacterium]
GIWVIYDQTTRMVVELRGDEGQFEPEWGNRVQVIGTTATSAESEVGAQIVDVSTLARVGAGGCSTVAAAIAGELPASAAPGPAAGAPRPTPTPSSGSGMSAGTKIAIVAAIGGGGAAAAVVLTKKESDRSP